MSGLSEDGSSLRRDEATEKGSTVDDNGVGSPGIGISGLREDGSSLRRDEATEKGSTVDDNGVGCEEPTEKGLTAVVDDGVGFTSLGRSGLGGIGSSLCSGLGRSGLGGIGSSLHCERRPRRR